MPRRIISPEVKDRIIAKIKNEGLSVAQASKEFEVGVGAIYSWIGTRGRVEPGALELSRLKRENDQLKQIIGALMLTSERGKKNQSN